MEAIVFFTLLFSVLLLDLSAESVISLHSFCNFHEHCYVGTGSKSCYAQITWWKHPAVRKDGMHYVL